MRRKIIITSRLLALTVSILLMAYILYINVLPLGVSRTYTLGSQNLSSLRPTNRVIQSQGYTRLLSDLVYFDNDMRLAVKNAEVKVAFKNPSPQQEIELGERDQAQWHYNSTALDAPFLDAVNWPRLSSNGLFLYQKIPAYTSVSDFLAKPPTDRVVGTFGYDLASTNQVNVTIPGYQPAQQNTVINTPLRGKTTLYAYLQNEPFQMTFAKQDLNWDADPDVTNIKVYKDNDVVAQGIIDDDGNASSNHVVGAPQSVTLTNNAGGNAESGVYKIVVDAPSDSVITRIETNLHKLAFQGPLYPVNNSKVYGGLATSKGATELYTDAPTVSAQTYHGAAQTVQVGQQALPVAAGQTAKVSGPTGATDDSLVPVIAPLSDAVINGVGYFSFTPDQFFAPTPYKVLTVNDKTDLSQVDYIITDYPGAPKQLGDGWEEQTLNFNLNNAVTQKGKLSWLISAPGLKENGRSIEIKSIDMTLTKQGWFK